MAKKSKKSRTPNIPATAQSSASQAEAPKKRVSRRQQRRNRGQRWLWIAAGVIVVIVAVVIILNNTQSATAGTPPPAVDLPAEFVDRNTKGNPQSPVVVTEYSDFECPACKTFAEGLARQLSDEYIKTGKILFEYKHYPLQKHEPGATWAANAAECAADQGKFWEMHDYLFQEQGKQGPNTFTQARLRAMAEALELDSGQFNDCLGRQEHAQRIRDDVAEARSLAVNATPSFFINGQPVEFSYPAIQALIEAELARAGQG